MFLPNEPFLFHSIFISDLYNLYIIAMEDDTKSENDCLKWDKKKLKKWRKKVERGEIHSKLSYLQSRVIYNLPVSFSFIIMVLIGFINDILLFVCRRFLMYLILLIKLEDPVIMTCIYK